MAPVWIYLAGILLVLRKYKHTEYIVTDRAVYVSSGVFSYACDMKSFAEFARVNIQRGIIDQLLGIGDVQLIPAEVASLCGPHDRLAGSGIGIVLENLREYREVFELVRKLQQDIYTDVMYPNALRPGENPGYNTKYTGM